MVVDSSGNLAPAPRDVAAEEAASAASESNNDAGFGSASVEWAEANGQGELDTAVNGTITNQYGEVMVVDSSGNLAPAPRTKAVNDAIDQANAPTAADLAAKAADVAAREAASSAPALQPEPEPEPEPAVLVTIELVGVSFDSDLF
jgi:hypothetical protein